jgi:hypothetical protein
LTRLQILEKQNKDLRIRLENREGKAELALCAMEDEVKELRIQNRDMEKIRGILQAEIIALTAENQPLREDKQALRSEIERLKEALDKAEDRAAHLAAKLKKNSSTSDKSPSGDFARAKAESSKEKSGKKVGGQPGHKGRRLLPCDDPDEVINKIPPNVCPCCGGNVIPSGNYESRQVFDVEIRIKGTEERVHYGYCGNCRKVVKGEFSECFNSHVGYGPTIKSIVAILNADANVPIHQTATFISSLTNGRIHMSDGTVVNIISDLAGRLDETVQDIISALAACGVLNVDETGVRINGNLNWIQIISNENFSLFGRNPKRGTLNEEMNNLLLLFTGILVHDHLMSYYGYSHISHAECNVHVLRYLKAVTQIMKHPWAKEVAGLLKSANKRKKELINAGAEFMDSDELYTLRKKYSEILANGQKEYEDAIEGKTNITYYTEERRLLTRLKKYIDEHLHFLTNFDVPFSNNVAEHGAKRIKGKKNTSGGFRSDGGVDNYAVIASVIATLRKQHKNIFSAICDSFQGKVPRFIETVNHDTG